MTGRWPGPVREPLAVGVLTDQDIQDALFSTVQHLRDPEDPAFDVTTFGALCAARAALVECADALDLIRIGRELHGQDDGRREWERIGQEYVARKVARQVIDELRKWLPGDAP